MSASRGESANASIFPCPEIVREKYGQLRLTPAGAVFVEMRVCRQNEGWHIAQAYELELVEKNSEHHIQSVTSHLSHQIGQRLVQCATYT